MGLSFLERVNLVYENNRLKFWSVFLLMFFMPLLGFSATAIAMIKFRDSHSLILTILFEKMLDSQIIWWITAGLFLMACYIFYLAIYHESEKFMKRFMSKGRY